VGSEKTEHRLRDREVDPQPDVRDQHQQPGALLPRRRARQRGVRARSRTRRRTRCSPK
jgi:hypothetical protein